MSVEEEFSTRIAGEIVLSSEPGKTMRKWRELAELSQVELAKAIDVSPSVVSDYERKRRVPGSDMVRRVVNALLEADAKNGFPMLKAYGMGEMGAAAGLEGVLDIKEFAKPVKGVEIMRIAKGEALANEDLLKREIYGYTVLDSPKAILGLSSEQFYRIFGLTSERALVFTKVSNGRSPFIAIRISSIKPGMVVLQGLKKVDFLGLEIARKERLPVVLSNIADVDKLVGELRRNTP